MTAEREVEIREHRRNHAMLEPGQAAELLNELDALRRDRDALWQLLDNIDTLDDAAREYDDVFRKKTRTIIKKRWGIHDLDQSEKEK
jgi:hypothetical protein